MQLTLLWDSWIEQHSVLATKRVLEESYNVEDFYRKKGEARELLAKEKKGLLLGQDLIFFGGRWQQGFYNADSLSFLWATLTDYLIGADQNIPDLLINVTLLVKV